MLRAGRVFERVSNTVVLFLCSSLGICFLSLSEKTYWPSWILVQSSPVISMFLWSGAVWGGRAEQKKAECTWGHEQTLLLKGASKEVEMGPRGSALLCPAWREQHRGLHVSKPVAQRSHQVEKPLLAPVQWVL